MSPDICSQLETTTVGVEAVRGERNHVPKEKAQATEAESSVDQRENVSRTSINMASKHLDAIGNLIGLELQFLQNSTDEILKKKFKKKKKS